MNKDAIIGHLTVIKGVNRVTLDVAARLGNLNWVTATEKGHAVHFADQPTRNPALLIGAHAAITHRHYIDCTDQVSIGEFSTFGGWGSQVLTHSIDISSARQRAAPVSIGRNCFVGTRVVFLKGSSLPDCSLLSAGSVLANSYQDRFALYSGIPAKKVSELDCHALYFSRKVGYIN